MDDAEVEHLLEDLDDQRTGSHYALEIDVQRVLTQTGVAVLVLSVDEQAGKVACMAAVPDKDVEAFPANNWLQPVLKEVDGRGGGKGGSAQGSGVAIRNVPKAIETARALADAAFA